LATRSFRGAVLLPLNECFDGHRPRRVMCKKKPTPVSKPVCVAPAASAARGLLSLLLVWVLACAAVAFRMSRRLTSWLRFALIGALLGSLVVYGNTVPPASQPLASSSGDPLAPAGFFGSAMRLPHDEEWLLLLAAWWVKARRRPSVAWYGTRSSNGVLPSRVGIVHAALLQVLGVALAVGGCELLAFGVWHVYSSVAPVVVTVCARWVMGGQGGGWDWESGQWAWARVQMIFLTMFIGEAALQRVWFMVSIACMASV
jgi:hypothetical protein